MTTTVSAQDAVANAAATGETADDQGGILVTAERRTASIQDVPLSISAVSGDAIARQAVYSMVDLTRQIPAVRAYNNSGNSLGGAIFMRGLGQDDSSPLADGPVGIYIDDVFIPRQWINNSTLFDLERVEVLRGPQGILYGRNTSAGAMKLVTKQPDSQLGGYAELGYGNLNQVDAKAVINVPLSEMLSMRLGASYQYRDGYIRNAQDPRENNTGRNNGGLRGQLRYDNHNDVVIDLSAIWIRSRTDGDVGANFLYPGSDLFTTYSGNNNESDIDGYIANLTAAYKGANWSLKSISAYTDETWNYSLDFSGSPSPVFVYNADQNTKTYSQEIQGSADLFDARLKLTGGLFAYYEDSKTLDQRALFGVALQNSNRFRLTTRSLAAYMQGIFALTDTLSVTGGLRLSDEVRRLERLQGAAGGNGVLVPRYDLASLTALGLDTRLHTQRLDPKVGLEFKPVDGLMVYASYTKGFRSGSFPTRQYAAGAWRPYDPEKVRSIEGGFKSQPFRGVTFNVSAYQATYDDYIGSALDPATLANIQDNVGTVRWRGVEGEARWRMSPHLTLFAGASAARGKVLFAKPNSSISNADSDSALDQTPRFAGNAGAEVWFGQVQGADVDLAVNYYHRAARAASGTAGTRIAALNTIDGSINVGKADGGVRFSVFCRNCTNQKYYFVRLSAASLGFDSYSAAEPRTYGVRARVGF